MRRGPGIAGLRQAEVARQQYRTAGEEVKKTNLQAMKEHMGTFKRNLEDFARKYKSDIRKDPVFRAQFHTMCANVGVDPLSSSKGMWAELLGLGDFYYELGVQILEAAWATRQHNGGLLELPSLVKYVNRRRGSAGGDITEDDVVRAVKKLKSLGGGTDLVTIGRRTYLRSVPGELNMDKNKVLELAQERGYVMRSDLLAAGWAATRTDEVLQALLREGLCMVDDGAPDKVRLFWFPCMSGMQG